MRISDWSSDVCSSDLSNRPAGRWLRPSLPSSRGAAGERGGQRESAGVVRAGASRQPGPADCRCWGEAAGTAFPHANEHHAGARRHHARRSEEHTSELQSLMRISYAVFCLKKKKYIYNTLKSDISLDKT